MGDHKLPPAAICAHCRYFASAGEKNTVCKLNPPVPLAVQSPGPRPGQMNFMVNPIWPPVGSNDWCGQWRAHGVRTDTMHLSAIGD